MLANGARDAVLPHARFRHGLLQTLLHFFHVEDIDDVSHMYGVHVVQRDAAFEAIFDFSHVLFEALETADLAFPDLLALPDQASHGTAPYQAFDDHAASHCARLADAKGLTHFRFAQGLLHKLGGKHAFHGQANVIQQVVDDRVLANLDAFALSDRRRLACGLGIEPHDD